MKQSVGSKVNNHEYPLIFHKNPFLLKITHKLTDIFTLRNWYVNRYLKRIFKNIKKNFILVDIGCGSGNILIPFSYKYKDSEFIGIDKTKGNIDVLSSYKEKTSTKNIQIIDGDVSECNINIKADVITIITVLQLIKDDLVLLKSCNNILTDKGKLLIYIPLKEKRFFTWYKKVMEGYLKKQSYENIHHTENAYSKESIIQKIKDAGFTVSGYEITYGTFGKIYFEVYSFLLHLFKKSIFYIPVVLLLIIILTPLFLLFMSFDFAVKNDEGNGLIIEATKQ